MILRPASTFSRAAVCAMLFMLAAARMLDALMLAAARMLDALMLAAARMLDSLHTPTRTLVTGLEPQGGFPLLDCKRRSLRKGLVQ